MPHSDSEVVNAWRERDEAQQLRRSSSAPGGSLPAMDLDAMTQEAVALFQAGDAQAALDLAVAFANDAEQFLGRTHPVHVNALATAQDLLEEAEALHEEHEMEQEYFELEAEMESGTSSEPEKPVRAPSPALSTHTGSRASGEIPQGHSDTEDEEAEAESIRRLTWEVKEFLRDGQPDLAAQLLAEAEADLAALISSESEEEDEDEAETPPAPPELRGAKPLPSLPVPTRGRSSEWEEEDPKDEAAKKEDPKERRDSRPSMLRERTGEEPPAAKATLVPTPPLQQAPSEEARPEKKAAAAAPKPIPKAGVVNPLPPMIPRQVATPPSKPPAKPAKAPTQISEESSEVACALEALPKAPEAKDALPEAPAKSCAKGPEPDSRQPSAQSSRTTTLCFFRDSQGRSQAPPGAPGTEVTCKEHAECCARRRRIQGAGAQPAEGPNASKGRQTAKSKSQDEGRLGAGT
eukprot:s938_g2.t1